MVLRLRPKFWQSFSWLWMRFTSRSSVTRQPSAAKLMEKSLIPRALSSSMWTLPPQSIAFDALEKKLYSGISPLSYVFRALATPATDHRSGLFVSLSSIFMLPSSLPSSSALATGKMSFISSSVYSLPARLKKSFSGTSILGISFPSSFSHSRYQE